MLEFIEKSVCNEFVDLAYWKDGDEGHLLLNIPDLLDYLYRSDCIQDYDLPPYSWGTDIELKGVDYPQGPEEDQKTYDEWVSLACFMGNVFNDEMAMNVIKYHERLIESEKVIGAYFSHLNKII